MPAQKQYTSALSIDQLLDLMNRLYNLNLEITTERNLPLIISRIDDVYLKMLLLKLMINGTDEFIPFKQSPNSVRSISVEPIEISDDKEVSLSSSSDDYLVSVIYNNNQRDDFICTYDETKWKCTARDINEVVSLISKNKQINKNRKSDDDEDEDDEDIGDHFFKNFKNKVG